MILPIVPIRITQNSIQIHKKPKLLILAISDNRKLKNPSMLTSSSNYHLIKMGLSAFEIAVGGITSIPILGVLIFLIYKAFGEKNLDTSKLKPKKAASVGAA